MHPEQQLEHILAKFQELIGPETFNALKVTESDPQRKGGNHFLRVRILGRARRRIWSSAWCFYEVGVGKYSVVDPEGGSVGGLGFICFADNKVCGSGAHRDDVFSAVREFTAKNPSFSMSSRSDRHIGTHTYYRRRTYPTMPIEDAANDLANLVSATVDRLGTLEV